MQEDKKRLDLIILESHPQFSRRYIQEQLIAAGRVKVDGKKIIKPGASIALNAHIEVNLAEPKFVSRAGFKLEAALEHFNLDVKDFIVLDGGVSTGGFSDCLLQRGAKKIYGVDVGQGQLAQKLLNDPRIVLIEKTNLRSIETLPEKVDLITLDLSFISVLKVVSNLVRFLKENGKVIILIKPQFEAEPNETNKNGLVKDAKVHKRVIEKVKDGLNDLGFECRGVIESPILGAVSGNKEFLGFFEMKKAE